MNILVTGGTGYLGSLIIKSLLSDNVYFPTKVISYSRSWDRSERLMQEVNDPRLRCINGDISDLAKLLSAMRNRGAHVDVVIHTAAYKSVPSAEYNPFEATRVNVYGTENVVLACIKAEVERCTFISSDKCVDAINLYGKTKALGESLIINGNNLGNTVFNVCRYGNVTGSTGSVIPFFHKIIQKAVRKQECTKLPENIKLPVTNPAMTRFWFTPQDACRFVLDTAFYGERGAIYVPKLKASTIETLVRAFGIRYDMDIEMELVGVRPGEKQHESMVSYLEADRAWDVGEYIVVEPFQHDWDKNWEIVGKPASQTWFNSNTTQRYTTPELAELL